MASLSDKVKLNVTGVPETAVYTLWLKANAKPPDKWAVQAVGRIEDYDFSHFDLSTATAYTTPLRTSTFDKWTTNFLDKHASATVVNLACGLESRALRILPSYPGVRWIDVDLPDIASLRKQLFPSPEGDYQLVAASVTETEWLKSIPADRPTIVAAEGLLYYLDKAAVEDLLRRLVTHFDSGELIFDTVGAWTLQRGQHTLDFLDVTGSSFTWAVDDYYAIEKLHPKLKFHQTLRHAELEGIEKMPIHLRIFFWVLWYIPWLRNALVNVRFLFGPNP